MNDADGKFRREAAWVMEKGTNLLELNTYGLESRVCHLPVKGPGKSLPGSGFQGGRRKRVGTYGSTSPRSQPCTHTWELHPYRQGRASWEATSLLGRSGLAGRAALSSGHLLFPASHDRNWDCAQALP